MKIEELRKMEDEMIAQKLSGRWTVEWRKGGIRAFFMNLNAEGSKKLLDVEKDEKG